MNLNRTRYDLPKYGADGHFGQETLKAVNNFKDDYGIYNRNIWKEVVDPKTENRLKKEVAKIVLR